MAVRVDSPSRAGPGTVPPVYLLGARYQHHAGRSGYEAFSRHVAARRLPAPFRARYLHRGWKIDAKLQRAIGKAGYSAKILAGELTAAGHLLARRDAVHHVLYGDTDLWLLSPLAATIGCPVVATFHEPPWGLDWMRVSGRSVRDLSAAILVSQSQREWFAELLPPERTFVVPHGVDTDFFTPEPTLRRADRPTCLVVGSKYRDFTVLSEAIDQVLAAEPDVRFVAIGTHNNVHHPLDDPRVEYRRDVDDLELLRSYREASVAVFPMIYATANNAMLEAMACGTPVVASDVGGTREYAGDAARLCPPYDADALAASILDVLRDRSAAEDLATAARSRALGFALRHVAAQHAEVYRAAAGW